MSDSGLSGACSALTNAVIGSGVVCIMGLVEQHFSGFQPYSGHSGAFAYCCESRAPAIVHPIGSSQEKGVFDDSPNVVVYYLPGTTGWGPTFSDRPAVLWNPQFDTGHNSFGGDEIGFGLPITGTADIPIVLEATTDLSDSTWVPLLSCTLTNGSLELRDPAWAVHPNRFYRIRSP
jgi:hypothetical protein